MQTWAKICSLMFDIVHPLFTVNMLRQLFFLKVRGAPFQCFYFPLFGNGQHCKCSPWKLPQMKNGCNKTGSLRFIPCARGTDAPYMSCLQSAMTCPVTHFVHFSAKCLIFRILTTVSMFALDTINDPLCIDWCKNNKLKNNGSLTGASYIKSKSYFLFTVYIYFIHINVYIGWWKTYI